MREITVSLNERSYRVLIGHGLFSSERWQREMSFPSRRGAIVTNTTVGSLYAERVAQAFANKGFTLSVIVIPDGEEYKTLSTVEYIYHELLRLNLDRKSFLLALGGGVITDITGFVASTFLRGIDYYQIPTSLLAQVDSSIGGKTGVNLEEGKNLVGTFYQPKGVWIDLSFLSTLPEREYREGLSEVLKAAFLEGGDFLALVEREKEVIMARDSLILEETVVRAVDFKRKIVEEDEREHGRRSILNYGHTIGHALEKALGYGVLRHGEAVALGMIGEAFLARTMGIETKRVLETQKAILDSFGLPTSLSLFCDHSTFCSALLKDKKKEAGKVRFVLLKDFGQPCVGIEVEEEKITEVISFLQGGKQ